VEASNQKVTPGKSNVPDVAALTLGFGHGSYVADALMFKTWAISLLRSSAHYEVAWWAQGAECGEQLPTHTRCIML
jgi:hypothetical protein